MSTHKGGVPRMGGHAQRPVTKKQERSDNEHLRQAEVIQREIMSGKRDSFRVATKRYYRSDMPFKKCSNILTTRRRCNFPLVYVKHPRMQNTEIEPGLCCVRCGIIYYARVAVTSEDKRQVSFNDPDVVLYVGKGTIRCRKEHHQLESVTGVVRRLRGSPIEINVNYCAQDKLYFISFTDYCAYRDEHGILLGNIRMYGCSAPYNGGYGFSSYADESPLYIYGYNVSKEAGLTEADRHRILQNMIDFNLMDKSRIIEYLDYFIRFSEGRADRQEACAKWRSDRMWVREYSEKQRRANISGTKRYKR